MRVCCIACVGGPIYENDTMHVTTVSIQNKENTHKLKEELKKV